MVKNPILLAVFIVTVFWWSIAEIFSLWGKKQQEILAVLSQQLDASITLVIALAFFLGGAVLYSFIAQLFFGFVRSEANSSSSRRGVTVTPGVIPAKNELLYEPQAAWDIYCRVSFRREWPELFNWRKKMLEKNSAHAKLFDAIARALRAKAYPCEYGETSKHGNVSLWEHSFRAAELAVLHGPKFCISEGTNRRLQGKKIPPALLDLSVLIALAHDMGKIVCFVRTNAGVEVRRKEHDREGARLLAQIDALWEIPDEERRMLLAPIAYEHHDKEFPVHQGDDALILLYFLSFIDVATAFAERQGLGSQEMAKRMSEDLKDKDAIVSAQTKAENQTKAKDSSESITVARNEEDVSTQTQVEKGSTQENSQDLGQQLISALLTPGVINAKDRKERLAYANKNNYRLFINEKDIRSWVARTIFHDPEKAREPLENEQIYRLTRDIAQAFYDLGVLVMDDGNVEVLDPAYALWKISAYDEKTKASTTPEGEWFVLEMGDDPRFIEAINRAPSLPLSPSITSPVFPKKTCAKNLKSANDTAPPRAALPSAEPTQAPHSSVALPAPSPEPAPVQDMAGAVGETASMEADDLDRLACPTHEPLTEVEAAQQEEQEAVAVTADASEDEGQSAAGTQGGVQGTPYRRVTTKIERRQHLEQEMQQFVTDELRQEPEPGPMNAWDATREDGALAQEDEVRNPLAHDPADIRAPADLGGSERDIPLELPQDLVQVLEDYRIDPFFIKTVLFRAVFAKVLDDQPELRKRFFEEGKPIGIKLGFVIKAIGEIFPHLHSSSTDPEETILLLKEAVRHEDHIKINLDKGIVIFTQQA